MMVILPDEFLTLSHDSENEEVVESLVKKVMKNDAPVRVTSLKGGITNQLLLVEQDGSKMLVRAFGKGTGNFIDRKREFAVHQQLQTIGLAPKLYGKFGNGLIYGYIPGRPAKADELGDEFVMKQVSRRLAQWHATLEPSKVAAQLPDGLGSFWTVLEKWIDLCPEGVLQIPLKVLREEFQELKSSLDISKNEVMGHCDSSSANISLPTETGTKSFTSSNGLAEVPYGTEPAIFDQVASEAAFIDYEYSIPCPRAFDIANHFQEWQGYECDKSRVPKPSLDSPKLKYWCSEYSNSYSLLTKNKEDSESLDSLVTESQTFWGMPGFYWGVWSAIQSQSSDIDFGYHEYASNRFQEYLDWKKTWKPKVTKQSSICDTTTIPC